MEIASFSDVGRKRSHNEDTVWTSSFEDGDANPFRLSGVLLVADGMGGLQAGEVASSLAAETARQLVVQENSAAPTALSGPEFLGFCGELLRKINRVVHGQTAATNERAGTTLTVAFLREEDFYVVNAGDSRAYLLRGSQIEQITEDDSLVAEYVRRGLLSPEEARHSPARNQITKAVGLNDDIEPGLHYGHWTTGDVVLLCSDGLTEYVRDEEIAVTLREEYSLDAACRQLVALANERGGHDNISVVVGRNSSGQIFSPSQQLTVDQPTLTIHAAALDEESTLPSGSEPFWNWLRPAPGGADERAVQRFLTRRRVNAFWLAGLFFLCGVMLVSSRMGALRMQRSSPVASVREERVIVRTPPPLPSNYEVHIKARPPESVADRARFRCFVFGTWNVVFDEVQNNRESGLSGKYSWLEIREPEKTFAMFRDGRGAIVVTDAAGSLVRDKDAKADSIKCFLRPREFYALCWHNQKNGSMAELARFHIERSTS